MWNVVGKGGVLFQNVYILNFFVLFAMLSRI